MNLLGILVMIRSSMLPCLWVELKYGHLAIPAKLHGPKGGRINECLLYLHINDAVSKIIFYNR